MPGTVLVMGTSVVVDPLGDRMAVPSSRMPVCSGPDIASASASRPGLAKGSGRTRAGTGSVRRMSPGPLTVRAALTVVLLAFAGAPPAFAAGGQPTPSASELQQTSPPEVPATPTAPAATATPTPTATTAAQAPAAATATPGDDGGGGAPWLIIG